MLTFPKLIDQIIGFQELPGVMMNLARCKTDPDAIKREDAAFWRRELAEQFPHWKIGADERGKRSEETGR